MSAVSFQVTPVYRCTLIREGSIKTQPKVNHSARAREVACEYLADSPCEQLIAFLLNTKLKIIGVVTITQGTLDCSLAHPREVLRPAILANASSFILAHNHPSGDLTPSREDWQVYRQIREAGKTVGIECIDSIIVNDEGESFSMSECGA